MASAPPTIIAINHDDYHADHVGHTADGRQFFLTVPFYLFDAAGTLIEARIDEFGPRATIDNERRRQVYEQRLQELGSVTFGRIEVAPFAVERFGTTFGLIVRQPEEEGDVWAVEAQPGNFMAFFEPWDSGDYDT